MTMSSIVEHDFGRSPFIEVGDAITFWWNGPYGTWPRHAVTGVVLTITRLYRFGSIAGQAREVEVGIPLDSGVEDEGSWQLASVKFSDIIARCHRTLVAEDEKEGKVLKFDTVLCNDPQDMV